MSRADMFRHGHVFVSVFICVCTRVWHVYHYSIHKSYCNVQINHLNFKKKSIHNLKVFHNIWSVVANSLYYCYRYYLQCTKTAQHNNTYSKTSRKHTKLYWEMGWAQIARKRFFPFLFLFLFLPFCHLLSRRTARDRLSSSLIRKIQKKQHLNMAGLGNQTIHNQLIYIVK
jgi:hypothetical protein